MARRNVKGAGRTRRKTSRSAARSRRLRAVFFVVVLGAAAYLYYQPLSSYVERRNELVETRAEVETLRAAKLRMEQRLAFSTSEEATRREARRMGYISPGEQLFIVKGIPDWRRAHARTLRGDG
ncbi:MAG: septum formation initiator family protein [Actinobacteria bacterium]|nr:septum formation initiator family protein [Actinomycetota bacterium]